MRKPDSRTTSRIVHGREVRLTNLDKVMYPETSLTKHGVADYYEAIAYVLLPQLKNRVVTQIRYPEGVGGERFFEKNAPASMPEWIRHFTISASPGSGKQAKHVRYPVIDDLAGLLWMVNRAALEMHTPQWRVGPRGGVHHPDRLVIDLDPGEGAGLDACAEVAHLVEERVRKDGLRLTPVTSGGKGLHLYAPVDGKRAALTIHAYVMKLARELAAAYPERIVAVQDKSERVGKVLIDWSQNHPARSTATPYTLRGGMTPMVAAPRRWEEITAGLAQLPPEAVVARVAEDGDLMAEAGLV